MHILADPAHANRAANPYNSLLSQHLAALGHRVDEASLLALLKGADLFHIHWPEAFLHRPTPLRALAAGTRLALRLLACRLRGIPVVWTVHNLKPHEARHPRLARWFYRWFPRRCAGLLFLSEATRQQALAADPGLGMRPQCVIAHGHYRELFPVPPTAAQARAVLGISDEEQVLLYFGMIRPYKNVPTLIRCFRAAKLPSTRLIVAGQVLDDGALRREVLAAADGAERITLRLRHHSEAELSELLAAATRVVLPYREIANSGSAILALSHDRPLLAPAVGALPALRAQIGADWLCLYEGELTPALLAKALNTARPLAAQADLSALDWPPLAAQTAAFFQTLIEHGR